MIPEHIRNGDIVRHHNGKIGQVVNRSFGGQMVWVMWFGFTHKWLRWLNKVEPAFSDVLDIVDCPERWQKDTIFFKDLI